MGSIGAYVQSNFANPGFDDSGILPGRQMRRQLYPARKQVILCFECCVPNPSEERFSGRLRNLELNRSLGLLLHDDRARGDSITVCDIADTQLHEIAAAQLTVNRQIEQRRLTLPIGQLEPNPYRPNFLEFEG